MCRCNRVSVLPYLTWKARFETAQVVDFHVGPVTIQLARKARKSVAHGARQVGSWEL